jgi:hypothetical protein
MVAVTIQRYGQNFLAYKHGRSFVDSANISLKIKFVVIYEPMVRLSLSFTLVLTTLVALPFHVSAWNIPGHMLSGANRVSNPPT